MLCLAGDRAFVYQRVLVTAPGVDMPVEAIIARIDLGPGEPAAQGRIAVIEHRVPTLFPMDGLCGLSPEGFRISGNTRTGGLKIGRDGKG